MSFAKTLGAVAGLALALVALAAPAAASTFTSPAGTAYTGTIKGTIELGYMLIHTKGGSTLTCETSGFEWKVESHGPAVTAKAAVTNFSFGSCGGTVVSVLKGGTVEFHKGSGEPGGFELVTWSGFEITIAKPFTTDCKYFFQDSQIRISMGGLTTSSRLGGKTPTFHLATESFPVGNSILCPGWAQMTGAYTITSPDYLDLDA
jgi:hypothetical protein